MPFELRDFQELVRLLRDHPEWREELRALLLTQELLTLPALVRELAETVARLAAEQGRLAETVARLTTGQERLNETVARLAARQEQLTETIARLTAGQERLTETVVRLAEEQQRLAAGQEQLTETVTQLAVRQGQLTERVTRLTAGQERLTETVVRLAEEQQRLAAGQERLTIQMGEVRGWTLEQRYRTQAAACFGRFLRQVQPVDMGRLADALRERLAEGDLAEVLLADLIMTGRLSAPAGPQTIWVVLEVSATVDRGDVERAEHRAAMLRQARYPAVAVAAGTEATAGARQAAHDAGVALLVDGRIDGWQEALERILAEDRHHGP